MAQDDEPCNDSVLHCLIYNTYMLRFGLSPKKKGRERSQSSHVKVFSTIKYHIILVVQYTLIYISILKSHAMTLRARHLNPYNQMVHKILRVSSKTYGSII